MVVVDLYVLSPVLSVEYLGELTMWRSDRILSELSYDDGTILKKK